ncbi:MAG TPA: hypothetical protein VMZ92_17735 [Planctomycetota bacterium]|nr:hypothetical protein [Planctomycetota bacterium]
MSEEPVEAEEAVEAPDAEQEPAAETPAPVPAGGFSPGALIVGAVTFVVVIGMVITVYVFTAPAGERPVEPSPADEPAQASTPAQGGFDNVMLLEDYQFTTTLPPTGDRSVTYKYSVTVKVLKSRRLEFEEFIDPDKKNMLPTIKESIRKIIGSEDYLNLRSEKLGDVKRRIKQKLNALMDAEVIEDVIFDRWDVIP